MKSTKKQIIFVFAILIMALVLSCALVACNKTESDKTGTDKDVCEHVEVTDNAVEPTCTEKGLTEGTHCSKCGKILQAQTEIPALGHDLEHHDGKEATCTEKGWKEYDTCKREGCDHTTYEEIPARSHTGGTATCTEQATCSVCGEKYGDALGHTGGTATCTEQATCSVCGEKYGDALGHNYGDIIPKTEPTCSEKGVEAHYKCSVCNKVFKDDEHKTETTLDELTIAISPNAHNFGNWIKNEGADTHTGVCSFNSEHTETESCHGGTATCIEQAVCEKCNAKYGELAKHDYKDGVCIVCGNRRPSEGLKYSLNSDGKGYTVTGMGTCTDKELIIPSEYNAKPVTSIGNYAFRDCTGLTSITILDSVTSIGAGAFLGCEGLTSVTIGNSVTSIGDYAFSSCTGLTSVTIGNSVTSIGGSAFSGCKLQDIYITDIGAWCNISGLGDLMSYGSSYKRLYINKDLATSITIPNGVKAIPASAFYNCKGLTSITIPDSVTSIGPAAFGGCSSLESITIPFVGAKAGVTSSNTYQYPFGYIFGTSSYDGGVATEQYYYGNSTSSTTSTTYYIPSSLKSVTVTGGNILYGAFDNCKGLTSVTIGNGVKSIGNSAFSGCTGLTSITVAKGNTKYHSAGNCLIETKSKTLIAGCKNSIIPTDGSVTSIGNSAFSGCTGLTSITIPNRVTSIGDSAFSGCKGLTSVTIPDRVTSISDGAFSGCKGLTSVTIPDRVTSIGDFAFWNCTVLTRVTIGKGVTSIGSAAFSDCYRLIEVYNKSTLSITAGSSSNGHVAYYAKNVYTNEGGSKLTTDENGYVIYTDRNEKILVTYHGTETELTLPSDITQIHNYAFYACSGLTNVTIPDSVTSIGGGAFYGCTGLTSITIPNRVTSIGDWAFYKCAGLTSVTIPDSVTNIGYAAFADCTGLTSITIPDSVWMIGGWAFSSCTGLTSIKFNGTIEQWNAIYKGSSWKYNVPSACKVICADGTVSI